MVTAVGTLGRGLWALRLPDLYLHLRNLMRLQRARLQYLMGWLQQLR